MKKAKMAKKLTVGIKLDKKIIFIKTVEVDDYFDANKLKQILEIFLKHCCQ